MEIAKLTFTPPLQVDAAARSAQPALQDTELPERKVVRAIGPDLAAAPQAGAQGGGESGWSERRVVIDPDTQQLVTETIDAGTREVVAQTPDRAILGLRAYIDGVALRQDQAARERASGHAVLPALVA